jgi:transposase-like protein
MDELQHFCCQNPDCPDYGQRGLGNLRVAFRYGPAKRRYLACRTCQHRFSELQGTALFHCHLPEEKALAVFAHLQEGVGIRKTSRLTGVNKNTVIRLALQAGRQSQHLHDEFVAFSPQDP